jgi:hypothetical protein
MFPVGLMKWGLRNCTPDNILSNFSKIAITGREPYYSIIVIIIIIVIYTDRCSDTAATLNFKLVLVLPSRECSIFSHTSHYIMKELWKICLLLFYGREVNSSDIM